MSNATRAAGPGPRARPRAAPDGSDRDGSAPSSAWGADAGHRPLRVFLADDHAVLRSGLRLLIDAQPDLQVVGEAGDGEAAVQLVAALAQDGGVLDIGMPRLSGLEALRQIHARFPDLAVLILTMHTSEPYLFQVIQTGG